MAEPIFGNQLVEGREAGKGIIEAKRDNRILVIMQG